MTICQLCGQDTETLYHDIEHSVIEYIVRNNPEWKLENGSCPKCVAHYRGLVNQAEQTRKVGSTRIEH